MLARFFEVLEDIKEILWTIDKKVASEHFDLIFDVEENVAKIAFLTDLFRHMNILYFKLQSIGKFVCNLLSEVKRFTKKIDIFSEDNNRRFHLSQLKSVCDSNGDIDIIQFEGFVG